MFDLKGKAKWDAWEKAKGKSKEEAMTEYVKTLLTQCQKHGREDVLARFVEKSAAAK